MAGLRTQKRRRRECKTDYKARLRMLKSRLPRIVVRRSNRFFNVQVVESIEAKDKVIVSANSKELLNYGWPKDKIGSLKSIPAGYLTGILIAKKIKSKKLNNDFIADFGLSRVINKSRLFSVLKGLTDSGINVRVNQESLPDEDRIFGKHISDDMPKIIKEIKSKIK